MNCRSVVNKPVELEGLLVAHDAEFALLTETWLSDDIFDSEFVPANYRVFRKDRDRRGGGVAILFKSKLRVLMMPDVSGVESIFCKVYINKIRHIIGIVYRPPNSSALVLDNLKEYLLKHVKPGDKLIMAGDYNLPNVDWADFSPSTEVEDKMLDIVFAYDLSQIVSDYTRTQSGSASILDLFFVSGSMESKMSCHVKPGISDHHCVVLKLEDVHTVEYNKICMHPNMSRADDVSIIDMLEICYDNFATMTCSVNELWLQFKYIVNECVERFVPKISKKSKNRNPWITRGTLQLQRKLKRLKKKYKSSTNVQQQSAIDKISSELKLKISQDKDKYFGFSLPSLIKASPERFWKTITPKSCSPDMFVIDGKCVHDDEAVAAAFNDYFT